MIEILYRDDALNDVRLDSFELEPFEKVIDRRGYLYIVEDSAFPEFIKVGRTSDLKRRLQDYNGHKPFNSSRYVIVSKAFVDVIAAEAMVLEKLCEVIPPTTFKKEWFAIEHRDTLEKWIEIAEEGLECLS